MTTLSADALALLEALPEPALVTTVSGHVQYANRSGVVQLGTDLRGSDLAAACQDPAAFRQYLQRASGSRHPLPGSLRIRQERGLAEFRTSANLLVPRSESASASCLIRLSPIEDPRFHALTTKVRELNAEIRRRQHAQAVLEETLQERNLLLRELHHRVKNNMQMLAGMLSSAQRDTTNGEARAILADACQRLVAVGTVQQMLYGSTSFSGVPAPEFMQNIASAVVHASGQRSDLVTEADDFELPNDLAVPVSLILNELLANALKYGRSADGQTRIRTGLRLADGHCVLSVEDGGPGFDLLDSRKRASGLGLVRGLIRQLGGTLSVERVPGARVVVRFKDRSQAEEGRPTP